MLGEWGGLIFQGVVTIAIVLGLIVGLYWLARRYSAGALGRLGRGRVPRLAVVDATAIDGRRQLVLVRRDNVEHLILIGGPSDVVVEHSIQRRRRPQTAAEAAGAVNQDASGQPVGASAENPPIPFPQVRQPSSQSNTGMAASSGNSAYSSRRAAAQQSPRHDEAEATPEPVRVGLFERHTDPSHVDQPAASIAFPSFSEPTIKPLFGETPLNGLPATPSATIYAPPRPPEAAPVPASEVDASTAAQVNDLEREMARLLGEITAKSG